MKDIEGTEEQLKESFERADSYLYKLLDYSSRESTTDEEIQTMRRDFAFFRQGPYQNSFIANPRSKLTSADVLYLLTSSLPATEISKKFDINATEVKQIRRGEKFSWYREYLLIRRLTTLIKARLKNNGDIPFQKIYSISELIGDDKYTIHYYTSSMRRAKSIREKMIKKPEYKRLVESNTLDINYPIKEIDIL